VTLIPQTAPTIPQTDEERTRRRPRWARWELLDLRVVVCIAAGLGWAFTVVDMAATPGGSPARLMMLLKAVPVACLLAATVGMPALPVINATAAAIIGGLLWPPPATGEPAPAVDIYAWAELVAVHATVLVSTIQLAMVMRRRRTGMAPSAGPGDG
jgi:predicted anti-sigma-YlaC factor YlaD